MKTNTVQVLTKHEREELRSSRSEIKEMREIVERFRTQNKDFEKKNIHLQTIRVRMFESLDIERKDLIGRILRIDRRIRALGFEAPQDVYSPKEASRGQ